MKPKLYIPPTSALNNNTAIYEPSEDSFLLIDAVSSDSERAFLRDRFPTVSPSLLVFEVGVGSGIVLGHVSAYAGWIFGRRDVLCAGGDVNAGAVRVASQTVGVAGKERGWKSEETNEQERRIQGNQMVEDGAASEKSDGQGRFLDIIHSSLLSSLLPKSVDVLLFNPPYVPTEELPAVPSRFHTEATAKSKFETESNLFALAYAGGNDGMEVTNLLLSQLEEGLSERGVAYILFCARNKPDEVKRRLEGEGWHVENIMYSGGKGGWERLVVLRVYRKGLRWQ
jgi:release factor glutamine methyltransferase